MDCSSVGEHVVVALLLVGARRHVAKVMDDARLVQNCVLEIEETDKNEIITKRKAPLCSAKYWGQRSNHSDFQTCGFNIFTLLLIECLFKINIFYGFHLGDSS